MGNQFVEQGEIVFMYHLSAPFCRLPNLKKIYEEDSACLKINVETTLFCSFESYFPQLVLMVILAVWMHQILFLHVDGGRMALGESRTYLI